MLTKVQLGGILGKKFGKNWLLDVNSPGEALRLIEANKPGLRSWIVNNVEKYSMYKVTCEYENGLIEDIDEDTYVLNSKMKTIKFMPIISGAKGGVLQVVVGAILIAASFIPGFQAASPYLMSAGLAMMLGGAIQMLSPRPALNANMTTNDGSTSTSSYFDGPVNTEMQGLPVPLIYGTVLVGSHTISASISVDEAS